MAHNQAKDDSVIAWEDETDNVERLRSILSTCDDVCEENTINIKNKEAYVHYTVKDFDLVDTDLDYDVSHYQKICKALKDLVTDALCSMIRGNDLSSGRIDIYREWKRGVVERDTKIVLDKADGYLSKGIYTYEPL